MSANSDNLSSICSWLTALPSQPLLEAEPSSPLIPTSCQLRKRKAGDLPTSTPDQQRYVRRKLTCRALKSIEDIMAPRTPMKSNARTNQSGLQTPDTLKDMEALEVKLTQSIHNIREALDEAGMRYDDQEAFFDRCPKFKEMIEAILNIPRGSIMRDESSRKTNMLIRQNRTKSEETFFNKVFGSIVPNTHTVDGKKRDHEGKIEQVVKNYHEDDSLDYAEKPRFSVGFVPGKTYRKKVKEFGLTEPVPDRVYGTRKPLFKKKDNGPPLPEWLKAMKSLNTHMDWPFGIFENKSCKIAIAEAENQALRDGGAVVNSRLKLKWYVHGRENQPCGADEEIFAFSVCWGPDFVRMFVHWFEKISNEEEYFHMNKVGQYFIDDKEHQGIMRKRIHNIFDFGLFKYVTVAEDTYKKAVAKYRQVGDNSETQSLADAAALESTVDTEEGDVERQ